MTDRIVSQESGGTVGCEGCGVSVPGYDIIHYGSIEQGYRDLCTRCYNTEVATALGLERFEHVRLQPIVMTDCAGERHEFHFRMRLLGDIAALEAFELEADVPGGYQFQIIGSPDDDPLFLLGRLIERMRRSLSVSYLACDEYGTGIADKRVCGRVTSDLSTDERMPLLVIDGREVSWDELGRLVMTFEGWQFRLDFFDRSEEIPRS